LPPSAPSSEIEPEALGSVPVEDLEDLYENAPCGYLSLLPDGRIYMVNATFLGWTGYTREQLIGKLMRDLLNVAARIFYETHFAPLLRMQGFFNEVALDVTTASGERLPVLANAVERRDAHGKLLFTRVSLFQASQRRKYERELLTAQTTATALATQHEHDKARLEARLEELVEERVHAQGQLLEEQESAELREHFIAVLSHDLRNPLASIIAGLRRLEREHLSEQGRTVVGSMNGSAKRMSDLINDVMDLARARLGGGIGLTRLADQSLEPVIQQVVAELQASHPNAEILIDLALAEPAEFDPGRVGQLLSNLLGNALTHGTPDKPVRVSASSNESEVRIAVANAGEAIPESIRQRLFLPFYRGDAASSKGLGLGLYIASEVAKAHGGRIDVESSSVETRFTFRMPNRHGVALPEG
jgi:sigma-B regulation protein RsbU (phosphoserine phosphatase)